MEAISKKRIHYNIWKERKKWTDDDDDDDDEEEAFLSVN